MHKKYVCKAEEWCENANQWLSNSTCILLPLSLKFLLNKNIIPISFSSASSAWTFIVITHTHNHFTALFPGPPRWAGARRELLDFMVQGKIIRGRHRPSGWAPLQPDQPVPTSTIPPFISSSSTAEKYLRLRLKTSSLWYQTNAKVTLSKFYRQSRDEECRNAAETTDLYCERRQTVQSSLHTARHRTVRTRRAQQTQWSATDAA